MDIREKSRLEHQDILDLNFINRDSPYVFNYHYNQGLRSHIIELLNPEDCKARDKGIYVEGRLTYPKPVPSKVLRIYKEKITLQEAMEETEKMCTIKRYLKENIAKSQEFIVSYRKKEGFEPILCGLQEYIKGELIDPWYCVPRAYDTNFENNTNKFINRIKRCINETGLIPDLAGIGNLTYSNRGVVLVDINNINTVDYSDDIFLDNKSFPIVDTSIEALSLLEKKVNGFLTSDKIYQHYLEPGRKTECDRIRKKWSKSDEKPFIAAN